MAYIVAALWPEGGYWLRSHDLFGSESIGLGSATGVNLLLAALLFNTGLAVPLGELMQLTRSPRLILLGLSIRITTCALILLLALSAGILFHGQLWDQILLGFILVTIMPVANSSAGWSHHSEANVGLSMWLILISVLLSPWLIPGLLQLASRLTPEEMESSYLVLAQGYAGSFVMTWVVIPAILGMLCRSLFLQTRYQTLKAWIKLTTFVCLVLLNYANGSVSLPEVLRRGHGLMITFTLLSAVVLCGLLFAATWGVGRLCQLSMKDRLSVMYSSAMSNTGVALVLVTTLLPLNQALHLVVIFYTLMQHIGAGVVDQLDYCWRRSQISPQEQESAVNHSTSDSSTITIQPVSNTSSGRPTTQTGSQAAIIKPAESSSSGS